MFRAAMPPKMQPGAANFRDLILAYGPMFGNEKTD
jgi:hypothetical protein